MIGEIFKSKAVSKTPERFLKILFKIFSFSLFLFFGSGFFSPLPAQEWPAELRFGVAEFQAKGLSPAYRYLSGSLPSELVELIAVNNRHSLNEEEVRALARRSFVREQDSITGQISRLRQERDGLFFDFDNGASRREKLEQDILAQEELLGRLEEKYKDLPAAPESLPLILSGENASGRLLPVSLGSPAFSKQKDLDYLLRGSIEEVEGLLLLECRIYSFLEGRDVYDFRDAIRPEELPGLLPKMESGLRSWLLGRPWADLHVSLTGVPRGEIILDGEKINLFFLEALGLEPGDHVIELRAPGYFPMTETISLLPGEKKHLDYTMVPSVVLSISLTSLPSGTDVYLDSRLAGTTPMDLTVPQSLSRILLRKEGYLDYAYYLDVRENKPMFFLMARETSRREDYRVLRRNNFYSSLGLFFLSIPLTVYTYSSYSSYAQTYSLEVTSNGQTQEALRLNSMSNLFYYGYWGSLGINVILFINLVLDAMDYVKAAEQDFKPPSR